ncbi:hypothetical protein C1645_762642 [Glomus cerebriforme]|uniref:Uncharacterized protein n=1 Tax=Glomus cerebriforme TaxID=658196 RepID=A0A397TEG1_9GLOM|nr:hypothetical protein C1645_762642 [Glomus cerebriforme]
MREIEKNFKNLRKIHRKPINFTHLFFHSVSLLISLLLFLLLLITEKILFSSGITYVIETLLNLYLWNYILCCKILKVLIIY